MNNRIEPKNAEKESMNLHLGFTINFSNIKNNIFIPGYYDPETSLELKKLESTGKYSIKTIGKLVTEKLISIKRGNEVGSQFYGLGDIPFVRTSDIVNWEIKHDPVKSLPLEVYEKYKKNQDIRENDILFVSDGTFLIGRTAIVTNADNMIVIQSHIKRIRCLNPTILHPYLLLFLLSTDIVQEQISEKTFVQATISTLGDRILELSLPIPKDTARIESIKQEIGSIIQHKIAAKIGMEKLFRQKL